MKYFIDFEATQFTNEIIEVGCIREDGIEFSSYVHTKTPLTNFIKNLTGIQQETIDMAPTPEEVFSNFWNWIKNDNTKIEFYCYGPDKNFIRRHINTVQNTEALGALSVMLMNLKDYSQEVRKHFGLNNPVALTKVLAHCRNIDSIEQKHCALEDAKFLKEVYEFISISDKAENPFNDNTKTKIKNPKNEKKKCIIRMSGDGTKTLQEFKNMNDAIRWAIETLPMTHRETAIPTNIAKRIRKASSSNAIYLNCKWKICGATKELLNYLKEKENEKCIVDM